MNAEMNQTFRIDDDIINSRDVANYSYSKGRLVLRSKGKTHIAYHEKAYEVKELLDNEFKFRDFLICTPY